MKTCPQGSYRKERENDEPITGLMDFDRLITMTTDFWTASDNGAPNKCISGKVCMSSKGLKIHQTKMGCLERQRPVVQEPTHKTPLKIPVRRLHQESRKIQTNNSQKHLKFFHNIFTCVKHNSTTCWEWCCNPASNSLLKWVIITDGRTASKSLFKMSQQHSSWLLPKIKCNETAFKIYNLNYSNKTIKWSINLNYNYLSSVSTYWNRVENDNWGTILINSDGVIAVRAVLSSSSDNTTSVEFGRFCNKTFRSSNAVIATVYQLSQKIHSTSPSRTIM